MRITLAVPLLLVFHSALVAQPTGGQFVSKEGRYSIRFPGAPKEHNQTTKTELGNLKVHSATYANADGSVFVATHTDYPSGAFKPGEQNIAYDAIREGLKGKDGKLVTEKDITVGPDKLAGREILIDKGKQQTRFQVVIKDQRLYQLGAVGTGEFVTGPQASDYFQSFEFAK